ncbi:MAG: MMPL family transporter [Natronomonas sp.]
MSGGERSEESAVTALVARLNDIALSRPLQVVVAVALVTAVMAGGLPLVTTDDDDTDAFTEGLPEQEALDSINDEFGDRFADSGAATSLVHVGDNVLSQRELQRNLELIERTERRSDLRFDGAVGPATRIAQQIDPTATTIEQQRRAVERATRIEIRQAVRVLAEDPTFEDRVADDFNPTAASASASVTVVLHDLAEGDGGGPGGGGGDDELESIQLSMASMADDAGGDIRVLGSGITSNEFGNIIGDSLAIVIPVVLLLILGFLAVAYRDPIDLLLGLVALILTLVWTFGFVGYAGIPFDQNMVSVPVLLLAVGIDFGIHIINRYREERVEGAEPLPAMLEANRQLVVAFFIVTVTTVFGFGANVISDLGPISNFGLVAAVGIIFTFVIFGLFLPAAKLLADRFREWASLPAFGSKPIASEDSTLGGLLSISATVTRTAPVAFVVAFLLVGAAAGAYGQGVDQSFETDDFLPPEDIPAYIEALPEPMAPGEYTVTANINLLEERFAADQEDTVTLYVVGPLESDHALESLDRPNDDPPDSFAEVDGRAQPESILTVIEAQTERDPEFAALVARNDRSGNGIPDRNLDRIYDELFASPESGVEEFLRDDRRATRIEYSVDADANQAEVTADASDFAEEFRFAATATGGIVVFNAVSDVIFASAIQSMALAIGLTGVFLVIVYGALERRPLLGLVNLFPILVTVALLVATMRAIGLPLNALTATLLSITIGVGVAYSVHITHRFIDEYNMGNDDYQALKTTLSGTGGALTGSMLTTSIGTGALVLAITPILGNFGLLMALSVFLSYLTAIFVLPPTLFVWARHLDERISVA